MTGNFWPGIDSATSTYACIWCKCPSLDSTSQEWSISDPRKGARTIEENLAIGQSKRKKFNVSRPPIFLTIPLTHVVVDNLHMFLRVADTLIDLLILDLRRLDCIEKATKLKDLSSLNFIQRYQNTVQMYGITGFEFWIGHNQGC